MKVPIENFWRIGRRVDPLHADPKFQGNGRFDDPEKLIGVLYGAPTLRACLLEFLLPWFASKNAMNILGAIPLPTSENEEEDAKRDRELAAMPRRVPASIYKRVAVKVQAPIRALQLTDLREIKVRERISEDSTVAAELRNHGFAQLDRGALLSPHRILTQAVAGVILHGELIEPSDGIYTESRHSDEILCVFSGGAYTPSLLIAEQELLSSEHPVLREVAFELGLAQ